MNMIDISVVYQCAEELEIQARYFNALKANAKVAFLYDGLSYQLSLTPSASGAKYMDGNVIWWNKGGEVYFTTQKNKTLLC